MAKDKNDQVIVAFFDNQGAADSAIASLQSWDKANDEIKLGAVGTMVMEKGKVKTNVGRKTGKGATVGTVIGVTAAVLSGGLTLIPTAIAGAAGGGIVGAFMKNSTHLTKEEIAKIGTELDGGKVAVVVTCDEDEIAPTQQQLISAGGTVRNYTIPQEAITEAAKAVPGADAAAVEEAPAEVASAALEEAAAAPAADAPSEEAKGDAKDPS